uniref:Uncharacterized protein n=1 Tax=Poecilia reticulata TaxID=8081 RepID=A0A3P9Q1P8_POERE
MDSFMSLGAPLKQFTSCVSGTKNAKKRGRSKGSQSVRRRSLPCSSQKVPDSWLRVYQEELKKERKRQQAMMAKKNAERTVRKNHFRSHHCLPRVNNYISFFFFSFSTKDDSFFGAFQGLSLDGLTGGAAGSPAVSAAGGEQCKVM